MIADTDRQHKAGMRQLENKKIVKDYEATLATLKQKNIFDDADLKAINSTVTLQFGMSYGDDGVIRYTGGNKAVVEDQRELNAFSDALAYALGEASVLKSAGKGVTSSELIDNVALFQQTRKLGITPLVFNTIKLDDKSKLEEQFENYNGTRNDFMVEILKNLKVKNDGYLKPNIDGIQVRKPNTLNVLKDIVASNTKV